MKAPSCNPGRWEPSALEAVAKPVVAFDPPERRMSPPPDSVEMLE